MEQQVQVRRAFPDGTAEIVLRRSSACSGDCHKCAGCGAVEQTMVVTAQNPIGVRAGDWVTIRSESGGVLAGAAVLYLLPLVLFFTLCLMGSVLWGCLGFVLGIAGAVVFDRSIAGKRKNVYIITGLVKDSEKRG